MSYLTADKRTARLGGWHPGKGLGVIAMKVFGQDWLQGKAPIEKLVYYSMSLPVSTAGIGMPKPEHVERNAALAWNFAPLPDV